MKRKILSIFLATIWISLSEFIRNELLFKYFWLNHYESLGLEFPSEWNNNLMWGIWSLVLAICIYSTIQKFSMNQGVILVWVLVFPLMWIAIGNLGVLPYGLLLFAVPLSLLEVFIGAWIISRINSIGEIEKPGENEPVGK